MVVSGWLGWTGPRFSPQYEKRGRKKEEREREGGRDRERKGRREREREREIWGEFSSEFYPHWLLLTTHLEMESCLGKILAW